MNELQQDNKLKESYLVEVKFTQDTEHGEAFIASHTIYAGEDWFDAHYAFEKVKANYDR